MIHSAATAIADQSAGAPMQRLADQLASLTPPPAAAEFVAPRPSPAVAAAIKRSAQLAELAAKRAQRARNRTLVGSLTESFIAACAFVPYSFAALVLRIVMARVFFASGQTMISGPRIPISVPDFFRLAKLDVPFSTAFDTSFVLPFEVKAATFDMFMTNYAVVPMPPIFAAYAASYASFVLPVMLVLGLGTRFAALGLLIMTAMIWLVMPEALWISQAYWIAILLVLISQGPGAVSIDKLFQTFARQ